MPVEKLNEVIHIVGRGFGFEINDKDNVSARTVGRVMKEGGIAAEMQIVHEIETAKGMNLSDHNLKLECFNC